MCKLVFFSFFFIIMWVLGIQTQASRLAQARAPTHWAISPAHGYLPIDITHYLSYCIVHYDSDGNKQAIGRTEWDIFSSVDGIQ